MKRSIVAGVFAVSLLLAGVPGADACKILGPVLHQVDQSLSSTDTTAPSLSEPPRAELSVHDEGGPGCKDSCDGVAQVVLHVAALDDRSPADRIGYRLNVVGGVVPNGITLPTFDTRGFQNAIRILWSPEESGGTFRFELSVAPIDEAGNVGGAQNVVVARSDDGGCSLGPTLRRPSFVTAAAIVLALAVARRRARTTMPACM